MVKQETALLKEVSEQGACGKNCGWVTACTLAGLCMGSGAFMYASRYAKHGVVGSAVLGPGTLIVYIVLKIIREVHYRYKHGTWFRPKNSVWVTDEGRFRWSSLIPLVASTVFLAAYVFVMTVAWNFAR